MKDGRQDKVWAEFTQTFEVPGQIVSARLQGMADYASLRIRINDQPVGQSAANGPLIDKDVSRFLLVGFNRGQFPYFSRCRCGVLPRDHGRASFGNGAIEGIMGPESANNAADQTAFIPTLSLGVPGSATMALMLGVLMIHGVAPGPNLISSQPELFWGLIMSFWVGNIILLVLNIPLIGLWVKLLSIPYHILYPCIFVFICLGVYSSDNSTFDIFVVLAFGVIGYGMRRYGFPATPVLLGFILGPLLEEHFRRAMLLARGDPMVFLERPISAVFLCASALLLASAFWPRGRKSKARAAADSGVDP